MWPGQETEEIEAWPGQKVSGGIGTWPRQKVSEEIDAWQRQYPMCGLEVEKAGIPLRRSHSWHTVIRMTH